MLNLVSCIYVFLATSIFLADATVPHQPELQMVQVSQNSSQSSICWYRNDGVRCCQYFDPADDDGYVEDICDGAA